VPAVLLVLLPMQLAPDKVCPLGLHDQVLRQALRAARRRRIGLQRALAFAAQVVELAGVVLVPEQMEPDSV